MSVVQGRLFRVGRKSVFLSVVFGSVRAAFSDCVMAQGIAVRWRFQAQKVVQAIWGRRSDRSEVFLRGQGLPRTERFQRSALAKRLCVIAPSPFVPSPFSSPGVVWCVYCVWCDGVRFFN